MQIEKSWNILKMGSSDEETLLESYCFLLNYHQEQIFTKRIEQGIYHDLLQKMRVNDRKLFQVICIMNFSAKLMKKNV